MHASTHDGLGSASRWLVINTQAHRETVAQMNLERQGYDAYCPMLQKTVRHARKSREVLRPLFPGYLFVRSGPEGQWRPILSTAGVRSLVRFGTEPGVLDTAFIDALKARETSGVITRPAKLLKVGQNVRLKGGAFDGVIGEIIEMDERNRVIVLMDLLSRPVKVTIDPRQVDPTT